MRRARDGRAKRARRTPREGNTLDVAALIDNLFVEEVAVREGDKVKRVTCIRAIVHQLWQKSLGGSGKAQKLYMRYMRFVANQIQGGGVELRFGPDMLTSEEVHRKHGRTS